MYRIIKKEMRVLATCVENGSIGAPVKINAAGNCATSTIAEAKEIIGMLQVYCERYGESWLNMNDKSRVRPSLMLVRPKTAEAAAECSKRWNLAHQVSRSPAKGISKAEAAP